MEMLNTLENTINDVLAQSTSVRAECVVLLMVVRMVMVAVMRW